MSFPGKASTVDWLAREYGGVPYLTAECGPQTYGRPIIEMATTDAPRRLTIGNYCSIAKGVTIYLGRQGRHPMDVVSTYPLGMLDEFNRPHLQPEAEGLRRSAYNDGPLDVWIGSEVWIADGAMIMAGVRVGHGAVIGARALVTSDVAPYEVVGGVPARRIKSRFPPEVVERLLATRWWEWPPSVLATALRGTHASAPVEVAITRLEAARAREAVDGEMSGAVK